MKLATLLILAVLFVSLTGCDGARNREPAEITKAQPDAKQSEAEKVRLAPAAQSVAGTAPTNEIPFQPVSLSQADLANTVAYAAERKIIRNATLTVEVNSPPETQRKIASIAESHQGFVVTSEATQRMTEDRARTEVIVNLVVRVPAAQFNQTMEEIRATGLRIVQEKITGQDVTEEFMDLEARIKNQKALESQFIEIMKRAGKVDDALSVQRELAEVRTEIEKLAGRRRFLENQSSLSTINVTLQPPTQIVNATGFWYSVKSAFSDGVEVALAMVLFLIRAVIALLPVAIIFGLPLTLIARFVLRRWRRNRVRPEAPATA
jgi:Domain of unknown function (DUF4349)